MKYLPHIDGLRAIAISFVFLFHVDKSLLPGGFIGVDIFFVISGFLITQIIWNKLESKNFSFKDFMIARLNRLFPAYAVMLILTSLIAPIFLLPAELTSFAKSAFYAIPFLSNIFFYKKSGYFEGGAEDFLLLHTWSLSVEWQFYLVFPALMVILYKVFRREPLIVFIVLAIIFSAISIYVTNYNQSLAFYLSAFRASEFLLGGMIVFYQRKHTDTLSPNTLNALSLLSISSLIYLAFALSSEILFPGWYAILVAILTALLIIGLNGSNGQLNKLLTTKSVVFFGKISYSFYLWHWPVLLFIKFYFGAENITLIFGLAVFLTTLLSLLSYYYVENMLRKKKSKNSRHMLVSNFFFLLAIIPSIGFIASKGIPERFSDDEITFINVPKWSEFPGKCDKTQREDKYYLCKFGEIQQKPTILFWGDSHAQVMVWAANELADKAGKSITSYTKGGCPPLFKGVPKVTNTEKDICLDVQSQAMNILAITPEIKDVVIAARWNGYIDRELTPAFNDDLGTDFQKRLTETIRRLQELGKIVHLIDTIPQPGFDVPNTIVRQQLLNKATTPFFENSDFYSIADSITNSLPDKEKLIIYRPKEYLCEQGACKSFDEGLPLYFDENHLSIYGVDKIKGIWEDLLSLAP